MASSKQLLLKASCIFSVNASKFVRVDWPLTKPCCCTVICVGYVQKVLKPFFEKIEIIANSETLWAKVLEKFGRHFHTRQMVSQFEYHSNLWSLIEQTGSRNKKIRNNQQKFRRLPGSFQKICSANWFYRELHKNLCYWKKRRTRIFLDLK